MLIFPLLIKRSVQSFRIWLDFVTYFSMFNIIRFYTSTISQCSSEVIIGSGNGFVPVHNTKTLHESMLTYCQLDLEEQILGKMKSNYKKFCLIESNKIVISVKCFCKCHSQTVCLFSRHKVWTQTLTFICVVLQHSGLPKCNSTKPGEENPVKTKLFLLWVVSSQ